MSVGHRSPRLAVLIDAENVSAEIADGLFEEIARIGEASVRRIYGNFSSPHLRPWCEMLSKHALIPHQQFPNTASKNAADIALVIDAMDLLHSGRFEGFCLVSSDSDFTRLAARIREQGIDVFGFGEKKTSLSFQKACRKFIHTESLLAPRCANGAKAAPPATPAAAPPAAPSRPPSQATPILKKAIGQMATADGWLALSAVGAQLASLVPDFDPHTYGASKLSDLVRKTNAFDIDQPTGGTMRIRPKARQSA